jgi:hypothetical protein
MKTINETFTEEEFKLLNKTKDKRSWHDFIMLLSEYDNQKTEELHGEQSPDAFNSNKQNRMLK